MKDKYINLLLIFLESCNYRAKYYIRRYNFQGNQFVLPPKSHFLHKNEVVATLVELFAIVPSILYFEVVFQFLFDLPYFLQVSNVGWLTDLSGEVEPLVSVIFYLILNQLMNISVNDWDKNLFSDKSKSPNGCKKIKVGSPK